MVKKGNKTNANNAWSVLAAVRVLLGFTFLWAFVDKTFGLNYATEAGNAWVAGGSPTTGYLTHVGEAGGPFAEFFAGLAGLAWVDWLFMLALLGVGVGLLFGMAVRLSVFSGVALLLLMWAASLPLVNNPVVDDHLVYAVVLLVFLYAEPRWSVSEWWQSQSFVKKNGWLW